MRKSTIQHNSNKNILLLFYASIRNNNRNTVKFKHLLHYMISRYGNNNVTEHN